MDKHFFWGGTGELTAPGRYPRRVITLAGSFSANSWEIHHHLHLFRKIS
jgi:hypothetical protein